MMIPSTFGLFSMRMVRYLGSMLTIVNMRDRMKDRMLSAMAHDSFCFESLFSSTLFSTSRDRMAMRTIVLKVK